MERKLLLQRNCWLRREKNNAGKKVSPAGKKAVRRLQQHDFKHEYFRDLYCSSNNRLGERGRGEREAKESKISFLFDIERNEVWFIFRSLSTMNIKYSQKKKLGGEIEWEIIYSFEEGF